MRFTRITAVVVVCAVLLIAAGCAARTSTEGDEIRSQVRADIDQIMSDISRAEEASPTISLSSNPYAYADISPAMSRLVSRGEPALDSIAEEIESSDVDGLREYLLAIAGQRIAGEVKLDGQWSTGKGWAREYRTRK